MPEDNRETCVEFASANQTAEDTVAKLFFLMQKSNNQAISDVLEFFESLSKSERMGVMHKLNVMPNATESAIQSTRKMLILLLTPMTDIFFAPRITIIEDPRSTRFPDDPSREVASFTFAS